MCSETEFSAVTIDLMADADLSEILTIEKESFISPWSRGMFKDEMAIAHSQCLVARINTVTCSVIGVYIIFWLVADEAHLHNLAVRKEFRRQGLGWQLMTLMKQIAGQVGVNAQSLEVRESNQEAIKLYEKCGFVVKGRRKRYYNDTDEDALIMWAEV